MTKDSITYEGETVSELKADFQNAVDSYIEGCQELGIAPRKPYSGVLNIRIPSEIHEKVALLAMQQGMTVNALIRDAITQKVGLSSIQITNHIKQFYDKNQRTLHRNRQ